MLKTKVIEFVTLNLLLGAYSVGPRHGHVVCCGRAFLRLASLTATISMSADMVKIVLLISGVSMVRAALGQVNEFLQVAAYSQPGQYKATSGGVRSWVAVVLFGPSATFPWPGGLSSGPLPVS